VAKPRELSCISFMITSATEMAAKYLPAIFGMFTAKIQPYATVSYISNGFPHVLISKKYPHFHLVYNLSGSP